MKTKEEFEAMARECIKKADGSGESLIKGITLEIAIDTRDTLVKIENSLERIAHAMGHFTVLADKWLGSGHITARRT